MDLYLQNSGKITLTYSYSINRNAPGMIMVCCSNIPPEGSESNFSCMDEQILVLSPTLLDTVNKELLFQPISPVRK